MPQTRPSRPPQDPPLYSELADDPDLADVLEMFVNDLPERARRLREAVAAEDFETLRCLAHQLKGAGGGYGFGAITDAAREVESFAGPPVQPESLGPAVEELVRLCRRATARPEPGEGAA